MGDHPADRARCAGLIATNTIATDTIAAVATPPGYGGIGIVRVSGPAAPAIARAITGRLPRPRHATFARFLDENGTCIDEGLVLYFPAPRSYTGEDVLELHGHGGPVVLQLLLARVLRAGARAARAGEFTERAFLNGRIDLAQAEAVADLIASGSVRAARAAVNALGGALSAQVRALVDALIALRVRVEAAIDFGDEAPAEAAGAARLVADLQARLQSLIERARRGVMLREGLDVVIAGRPNVGKSSLLNRLAGDDRAIVSPVPGTTRDLLRERVVLGGLPVLLVDTAGLRTAPADAVEAEGMRRAEQALAHADEVLLVVEAGTPRDEVDERVLALRAQGVRVTVIHNKIDLIGTAPRREECGGAVEIHLCAANGDGVELLVEHLGRTADAAGDERAFTARARQIEALERARDLLAEAAACAGAEELLAEQLRLAQLTLAEITGDFTSDDLLGEIFSTFCIGK